MSKGRKRKNKLQEGADQQPAAGAEPAATPAGDGTLKVEGTVPLDTRATDGEVIDPAGLDIDSLKAPLPEVGLVEAVRGALVQDGDALVPGPTKDEVVALAEQAASAATEAARLLALAETSNDAAQPVPTEQVEKAVAEGKAKLRAKDPDDDILPVEEAAASMVDGFKESWLPAIRAKARSMGVEGPHTRRVWRGVFLAWGGQSILR